jgi:hypothetical protein
LLRYFDEVAKSVFVGDRAMLSCAASLCEKRCNRDDE